MRRLPPLLIAGLACWAGWVAPLKAQPIGPTGDLRPLVADLAGRVQHLGEDIALELRQTAGGRHLIQDTQELAASVEALDQSMQAGAAPEAVRRDLVEIDGSWHHLQAALNATDVRTPGVARAVARVAELDPQVHQALGLEGPVDVGNLMARLDDRVERLGEDVADELGQTPGGRHLIDDTRELAQSIAEFRAGLAQPRGLADLRQGYAGIDASWHHLRAGLGQPGLTTPAIGRSLARVDAVDNQIHQALGLNPPPAAYYGQAPPTGMDERQRLAVALESRAAALANALNAAELAEGPDLSRRASRLVRACDRYHDALAAAPDPAALQAAFTPIAELAEGLEPSLSDLQAAPPVQQAWQSFAATEYLVRQDLGLPVPPPTVATPIQPEQGPSPLVALADQLAGETEAFFQAAQNAPPTVPEREASFQDAQRLMQGARAFRDAVAAGVEVNRLAYTFRDVDATWRRLVRRVDRLAKGRTGPNIDQVHRIGAVVGQIHQLLGIPGPFVLPASGQPVAYPFR